MDQDTRTTPITTSPVHIQKRYILPILDNNNQIFIQNVHITIKYFSIESLILFLPSVHSILFLELRELKNPSIIIQDKNHEKWTKEPHKRRNPWFSITSNSNVNLKIVKWVIRTFKIEKATPPPI
jgi:hypothetical protein